MLGLNKQKIIVYDTPGFGNSDMEKFHNADHVYYFCEDFLFIFSKIVLSMSFPTEILYSTTYTHNYKFLRARVQGQI